MKASWVSKGHGVGVGGAGRGRMGVGEAGVAIRTVSKQSQWASTGGGELWRGGRGRGSARRNMDRRRWVVGGAAFFYALSPSFHFTRLVICSPPPRLPRISIGRARWWWWSTLSVICVCVFT